MKKTSAKNKASRPGKSSDGPAAGRANRATNDSKRTTSGSGKAAASSRPAATKSSRTTAKTATQKTAAHSNVSKQSTPRSVARQQTPRATNTVARGNIRSTTRIQQSSAKDLLMNFFQDEIKDIYWAEKHIVKTLPKLKKAATSPQLKTAFDQHTTQSQEHVNRLDKVFQHLGKKAQAKKCEAMNGIIQEGEEIISHTEAGTATRDVGLILAAQKVEHYEIATYGGLAQLARTLQLKHIAALLETTLREEKETDTILSTIAEQHVNYDALHESEAPQAAGGNEDEDEEETDIEIEFDEVDIDVADDEANEDFDDMEEDLDDEER